MTLECFKLLVGESSRVDGVTLTIIGALKGQIIEFNYTDT